MCALCRITKQPLPSAFAGYYFNPKFNITISEIFKTYRKKHQRKQQLQEEDKPTSATTSSEQNHAAPPSFTPKMVPLSFFMKHSGTARSYKDHHLLPPTPKSDHLLDVHLPHSLTFLLTVCSEVVGTSLNDLYSLLLYVEGFSVKGTLHPLQKMMEALGRTSRFV